MRVTYFRASRPGPEVAIENAVLQSAESLLTSPKRRHVWIAASLPVGAGMPDLLFVAGRSKLTALAACTDVNSDVLAYLAAVKCAKPSTVISRLKSCIGVAEQIDSLLKAGVLSKRGQVLEIRDAWRTILPEIVSVEAKVSNWKRALQQATRNRIFAHRSYVALPKKVVERVVQGPVWKAMGVGLISVSESGEVEIVVAPKVRKPRAWSYYYRIASEMARNVQTDALQRPSSVGSI